MSARKSERIMNLTICLLLARRFVDREQIRRLVEGYAGLSDAAFERTFERDKEDLRALGVPIETGSNSALFPDEVGYRIRRTDFELPPVQFDAAETAVLGLASGVWDSARLAGATTTALAKLRAAGVDPDAERVAGFAPRMAAREPGVEALWPATLRRSPVAFRYRGVDRVVEPWARAHRSGAWYAVGLDRVRGEGRAYKLSRVEDTPRIVGRDAEFDRPDPDVVAAHLASLEPQPRDLTAVVAVRDGAAGNLIRDAEPAGVPSPLPGHTTWRVSVARAGDAAAELAEHGDAVLVLDPPELRAAVIAHLEAVAAWR